MSNKDLKFSQKLNNSLKKLLRKIESIFAELDFILQKSNIAISCTQQEDIAHIDKATSAFKKNIFMLLSNPIDPNKINAEEKSEYLLTVRHNFRDYMNSIQGYNEILLEELKKQPKSHDNTILLKRFVKIQKKIFEILKIIDEMKPINFYFNIETASDFAKDLHSKISQNLKNNFSILIVDDIQENCEILERTLKSIGYEKVTWCLTGLECLNLLTTQTYNLVLLDINIPDINGLDILQFIKNNMVESNIMVILITGSDTLDNALKGMDYGAEDLITKPFNTALLRVRVNVCCEKKIYMDLEAQYKNELEKEKQNYKELLQSVFPPVVMEELMREQVVQARVYQNVAILFIDLVDFSDYCSTHSLPQIIRSLQTFSEICEITANKYHIQKIKTVGDAFLAIAGMLTAHKNPVLDCIKCVEEIVYESKRRDLGLELHGGIDCGSVIGGIVGHHQYLFDIWGQAVNTASSLQVLSAPNTIYLTHAAKEAIKDHYKTKLLGNYKIKGVNTIEVYEYRPSRSSLHR